MTERHRTTPRQTILRITAIAFIICLASLLYLIPGVIHHQIQQSMGEADPSLSRFQAFYYDLRFFIDLGKINAPSGVPEERAFTVEGNQDISSVIYNLKAQNLIADEALFRMMLIYTGADRRIMPGTYLIPAGSSMREVSTILQDVNASLVKFNVLPGWRKEEIAAALPTSGLAIPVDQFLAMVNQPLMDLELTGEETISHEGFLAPGSYSFRRSTTVNEFIDSLVNQSRLMLSPKLKEGFTNQGLTTYQAVILASIIQREAILDDEKPLIASVFLNRLRQGIPLQSDPTAQYALGFNPEWGWWKSPLSLQDVQIESTYNTYMINGLPPSPISNPDGLSLKAVAFPAESTYLFFRAACDNSGRHEFSQTIEEHTMNGCSQPDS